MPYHGRGALPNDRIFKLKYVCHHSGSKRVNGNRVLGNSAKARPVREPLRSEIAPQELKVTYSKRDLDNVHIEVFSGQGHNGHKEVPGSTEDAQYPSLSQTAKAMIRQELEKGYS